VTADPRIIRRYTNLASALHILRTKTITLLPPDSWDDRNDRALMAAYKARKRFKSVLALCFSQAADTYHHWKVFASGTDGVFVEFEKKRLLDAIACADIQTQPITYVPIGRLRNNPPTLDELPFSKRLAYRDEAEFRIVYTSKTDKVETKGFSFPQGALERVMLNPWLPEPLVDTIRQVINSIEGCELLDVSQSRVTDSPAWRKLAASYA
jgi:hypothetical protein